MSALSEEATGKAIERVPVGVVHGRFQLLHNDHVKFILTALEHCDRLIIGICNPDVTRTKFNEANPHRSKAENNPFTYYERYRMIKETLCELSVEQERFDIVPFPINYPELIFNYTPKNAKYFLTIYDEWGEEKLKELEKIGCDVEVLWKVDLAHKGLSGSDIRDMMQKEQDIRHLVPAAVHRFLVEAGYSRQ